MWALYSRFGDNVYVQETFVHFLGNPELKMPLKIFTFSDITYIYIFKIYYFTVTWKNVVSKSDIICIVWDKM